MIDGGIAAALLCAMVWLTVMAQGGHDRTDMHNRQSWMFLLIGLAEALWLAPLQLPAALLLVSALAGIYWVGFVPMSQGGMIGLLRQRQESWKATGYRVLVVAGGYATLIHVATSSVIIPVLWAMVVAGVAMAGFAAIVVWTTRHDPYGDKRCRMAIPWTPWFIQDDEKGNRVRGGQGNPNHFDGLQAMSVGAMMGLIWTGTAWVAWLLPVLLMPFVLHAKITQGLLHLTVLATAAAVLLWGWIGWLMMGAWAVGAIVAVRPWNPQKLRWDAGRVPMWAAAIRFWWTQPARSLRLLGFGMTQWVRVAMQIPQPSNRAGVQGLYTHAHNEWVHQVIEHGLIGFALLVLYVGTALWHLVTGPPEAQALWLVALPLCSAATVNFPWSFFQEVDNPGRTPDPWPRFYTDLQMAMKECEQWMEGKQQWADGPRGWKVLKTAQQEWMTLTGRDCEFTLRGAPSPEHPNRLVASLSVSGKLMQDMVLAEEPLYVGSPGLVAWSFVVAVCAAVV